PFLVDLIKERSDVGVQYVAHLLSVDPNAESIQRVMRAALRPESVRHSEEALLVNRIQQRNHCPLDDLVFQGSDRERAPSTVRLGYEHPPARQRPIRSPMDPIMQILEIALEVCLVVLPCQSIHTRGGVFLECGECLFEQVDVDVVEERGEPLLLPLLCDFPYAFQR